MNNASDDIETRIKEIREKIEKGFYFKQRVYEIIAGKVIEVIFGKK